MTITRGIDGDIGWFRRNYLEPTPMRTRQIVIDRLPVAERVREIEALAHAKDVTPYQMRLALRALAHGSLHGGVLWAAWMRAEAAVLVRDATDEDDGDYPGYADEADAAITDLIHGTRHSQHTYGGGGAA